MKPFNEFHSDSSDRFGAELVLFFWGGGGCLNNKNKGTSGQCLKLDDDLRRGGTALKIIAFLKDL